MNESDIERVKNLLDSEHTFPTEFLFKFIVPKDKVSEVTRMFHTSKVKTRESRRGNYVALSMHLYMESSDEVIQVYQSAKQIEGMIAL